MASDRFSQVIVVYGGGFGVGFGIVWRPLVTGWSKWEYSLHLVLQMIINSIICFSNQMEKEIMGLWSANLAKLAAPLPELIDLPATEARMIMALRLAVAANKQGVDARDALEKRLGGRLPMIRF